MGLRIVQTSSKRHAHRFENQEVLELLNIAPTLKTTTIRFLHPAANKATSVGEVGCWPWPTDWKWCPFPKSENGLFDVFVLVLHVLCLWGNVSLCQLFVHSSFVNDLMWLYRSINIIITRFHARPEEASTVGPKEQLPGQKPILLLAMRRKRQSAKSCEIC